MNYHGGASGGGPGRGQFNRSGPMKRPYDASSSEEPRGKKNPLELMQMVIKNSQKDLMDKTAEGLPEDPETLKKIFTRQQMLLELQSEMMTQMAKNEGSSKPVSEETVSYPKRGQNLPNEDFYYGFNEPSNQGRPAKFKEEKQSSRSGGPPEPLMQKSVGRGFEDMDVFPPRGRGMMGYRDMMDGPRAFGPRGYGPRDFGPRGFGPMDFGPMDFGPMEFGPRDFGPRDFGPRDFGPRGFDGPRGMRFQGRGGQDGRPGRKGHRKPADPYAKGRGMPPCPEEAWDANGRPGNPLNRPYNSMATEDRLTILQREIFKYDNFPLPLKVLETARHNYPDAHLRTFYDDEPVPGTEEFIGHLDFNGVLMAIKRGDNKIDAKVSCYNEALYLLSCKPISYIFSNQTLLRKEHAYPSKDDRDCSFVHNRLMWVLNALHDATRSLSKTSPDREFEEIICQLNLGITEIYTPTVKGYKCEMYIDDLYAASGEAIDKFESHKEALANAREAFFKVPSKNEHLLKEESRLSSVDFFQQDIVDIKYFGFKHKVFTNIDMLQKKGMFGRNLLNVNKNIVAVVPVDESSDWKCLDETAAANDILMEYVENGSGTCARCIVYLQGQCYADSYSSKVDSAKQVAMGRAKYILLKKCTVIIERKNVDFSMVALTFEQVVEKAGELCMSQPKLLDGQPQPTYKTDSKDPAPNDLSPWVDAFLKDLVYSYGQTDGLDDLIISHLPTYHAQKLLADAKELEVAVELDRYKNTPYVIVKKEITNRLASQEFIDYMKDHGCNSGRYKLTFKEAYVASDLTPATKSKEEKELPDNFKPKDK